MQLNFDYYVISLNDIVPPREQYTDRLYKL